MFYQELHTAILALLWWWGIFLVFQRLKNRYQQNTWRKDFVITFAQSLIVILLLPLFSVFLKF